MLEGINKVDWQNLRHFNGRADNIPKLLQDLLSNDKKTQSSAILQLFDNIWHHGTVYEATAQVVPFLYEILESPSCSERFSIVWLLGVIAKGSSERQVNHSGKKDELEQDLIWAKNAHIAVRQEVKTILGLLDEKDKDLRLPVVLLLASLPEEAGQIKPILSSILSIEKNTEVRAGLGLALALLEDFHLEAFRSEDTKLPLILFETLAKACMQDEGMRVSAFQTIEECFLATMEQKDKDWLFEEKTLLETTHLNLN
jgi:hypothetical protein